MTMTSGRQTKASERDKVRNVLVENKNLSKSNKTNKKTPKLSERTVQERANKGLATNLITWSEGRILPMKGSHYEV